MQIELNIYIKKHFQNEESQTDMCIKIHQHLLKNGSFFHQQWSGHFINTRKSQLKEATLEEVENNP